MSIYATPWFQTVCNKDFLSDDCDDDDDNDKITKTAIFLGGCGGYVRFVNISLLVEL